MIPSFRTIWRRGGIGRVLLLAFLATQVVTLLAMAGQPVALPVANEQNVRTLMNNPFFVQADNDNLLRFLVSQARELRGSPLSELALRMALDIDPARLASVTAGEAEARKLLADPDGPSLEVKDLARRLLSRALVYSGRGNEALTLDKQRGLAMQWSIAGPFHQPAAFRLDMGGIPNGSAPIDLSKKSQSLPSVDTLNAWRTKPPWRRIPEAHASPFVQPWKWITNNPGAISLKTFLRISEADSEAVIHVNSNITYRLIIDGVPIAILNYNNAEPAVDQIFRLPLSAGWHKVELHCLPPPPGTNLESAKLFVRASAHAEISWAAELPSGETVMHPYSGGKITPAPPPFLNDLAEAARKNPDFITACAVAYQVEGMLDEAQAQAETVVRQDPYNPLNRTILGRILRRSPHLSPSRRIDRAATAQQRALAIRADFTPAIIELAEIAMEAGNSTESMELIKRALQSSPRSSEALMLRGEWFSRFSDSDSARKAWEECLKVFPGCPEFLRRAAESALAAADTEQAIDFLKTYTQSDNSSFLPMLGLADIQAAAAADRDAAATLRDALGTFVNDPQALEMAAKIYTRLEMYDEAENTLWEALFLRPDDATLWLELGDIAERRGNSEASMALWKLSLAADPGRSALRDLVLYREGRNDDYRGNFARNAMTELENSDNMDEIGNSIRVLDQSVVTVAEDGSFRRFTHEVDKALTRDGAESLSRVNPPGECLVARTILPNGMTLEPLFLSDREWWRLPAMTIGSSRELQVLESVPLPAGSSVPPPLGTWYFQDPSQQRCFLRTEYVVRVPKGMELTWVARNNGGAVKFESNSDDTHTTYHWTADKRIPVHEPDAVHVSERLPLVEAGIASTWEDVNLQGLNELTGRLTPTKALRDAVSDALRLVGRADPKETARRLYRLVCDTIDIGPDTGSASQILSDRLGNRHILLLGLLNAAGLDAQSAAARPHRDRLHEPTWELPRLDYFPIRLIRLILPSGEMIWLDTRYDFLAFGELAEDLSEATAMVFLPTGPIFETTPRSSWETSTSVDERVIKLPNKGRTITVNGSRTFRRTEDLIARKRLADSSPDPDRMLLAEFLKPVFPSSRIDMLDFVTGGESSRPELGRYIISDDETLEARDGHWAIPLCLPPINPVSAESMLLAKRQTACHIRRGIDIADNNRFLLPAGAALISMPAEVSLPSRFGLFQIRVSRIGDNIIEVTRTCRIQPQRIEPDDWPVFINFVKSMDIMGRQWIEYSLP